MIGWVIILEKRLCPCLASASHTHTQTHTRACANTHTHTAEIQQHLSSCHGNLSPSPREHMVQYRKHPLAPWEITHCWWTLWLQRGHLVSPFRWKLEQCAKNLPRIHSSITWFPWCHQMTPSWCDYGMLSRCSISAPLLYLYQWQSNAVIWYFSEPYVFLHSEALEVMLDDTHPEQQPWLCFDAAVYQSLRKHFFTPLPHLPLCGVIQWWAGSWPALTNQTEVVLTGMITHTHLHTHAYTHAHIYTHTGTRKNTHKPLRSVLPFLWSPSYAGTVLTWWLSGPPLIHGGAGDRSEVPPWQSVQTHRTLLHHAGLKCGNKTTRSLSLCCEVSKEKDVQSTVTWSLR